MTAEISAIGSPVLTSFPSGFGVLDSFAMGGGAICMGFSLRLESLDALLYRPIQLDSRQKDEMVRPPVEFRSSYSTNWVSAAAGKMGSD